MCTRWLVLLPWSPAPIFCCLCSVTICCMAICLARCSAAFICSMWNCCLSCRSCCLWYSNYKTGQFIFIIKYSQNLSYNVHILLRQMFVEILFCPLLIQILVACIALTNTRRTCIHHKLSRSNLTESASFAMSLKYFTMKWTKISYCISFPVHDGFKLFKVT